jgi:hypothetical protein
MKQKKALKDKDNLENTQMKNVMILVLLMKVNKIYHSKVFI